MKRISIILIIMLFITSCSSFSGVIACNDYSINPFDNSQYCVSWE